MTKIFTDSEGNEYELKENIAELNFLAEGSLVIKPVKEEKQIYRNKYSVIFWNKSIADKEYKTELWLTDSQAKAVSKAIEQLMKYITDPNIDKGYEEQNYIYTADKAREALND